MSMLMAGIVAMGIVTVGAVAGPAPGSGSREPALVPVDAPVAAMSTPAVGMAMDPATGGYWLVASDGGVFSFNAPFYGSLPGLPATEQPGQPVVAMAPDASGQGYWEVTSAGDVYSFGNATFQGSTGNISLAKPVVGMAMDPATGGYWLVAADGGVFSFNAPFFGSLPGLPASEQPGQPVVGMAVDASGQGYFEVTSAGDVYSFGNATFQGSTGNISLAKPVVGMAMDPATGGYWLVASDGGVFSFNASFFGGVSGLPASEQPNQPVVAMAPDASGQGYWEVTSVGGVYSFGNATFQGSTTYSPPPAYGDGYLPPANPPANIPPNPNFDSSGLCQWTPSGLGACANPCYNAATNNWYVPSQACTNYVLAAVNNARAAENVAPMVLPTNWASLTPPERLFVLADLERTARGLPPYLGMVPALDVAAQQGAAAGTDPSVPNGFPIASNAAGYPDFGGAWSGGGGPLEADYGWMYNDGWGGSQANTFNFDCTSPTSSACWGHRDELLGQTDYGGSPWGVGLHCTTCVMGTGFAASTASGWANSADDLVVKPAGAIPSMVFTWASNVAPYLPGA